MKFENVDQFQEWLNEKYLEVGEDRFEEYMNTHEGESEKLDNLIFNVALNYGQIIGLKASTAGIGRIIPNTFLEREYNRFLTLIKIDQDAIERLFWRIGES